MTGNFRGVCPLNRAAENLCASVYRHAEAEPAGFILPVFFLSWSDTHEIVVRKSSHRTKGGTQHHHSYVKEETNHGSSERNDPHPSQGL